MVIKENTPIQCFKIDYKIDAEVFDDWALHIRRNYINDDDLLDDAAINGMTVEQYLKEYVIPQKNEPLGPTARSGDMGEIIISDLLEFILEYSVPRYKMKNRSGKNNSQQGTDIIAYKFYKDDKTPNENDELVATEVKTALTKTDCSVLENAIKHSAKDSYRLARTVDHCRKRLRELGNISEMQDITRFLNKTEKNYKLTYVAAGISSCEAVSSPIELGVLGDQLEIKNEQKIFFIHGRKLMDITHDIYERCRE
ncbi:Hachiman antiphage defense system protein HamA [Emergencia timonensis]|uniref:Hachiman antiphage defense system protein HamA n=1 Tax=Emergencia timonensis TaxID=1776384 RepID=UPI0039917397